jgi:hypothetical protein
MTTSSVAETLVVPPRPDAGLDLHPTAEQVAFFREQGYLVVDRLTTDEELDWLRAVAEAVLAAPSPLTHDPANTPGTDGPSLLTQSMFPEIRVPALLEATYVRNARRFAAALLGLDEAALSMWGHLIHKPPLRSSATPWHQDEAYWEPEFDYNALGVWLPLHEVSVERGCMQFIPGSHKGPVLPHRHAVDPTKVLLVTDDVDPSESRPCPLPAGAATFHHPRTLHYTAPNTTRLPRFAYPIEFQAEPTRRTTPADRPWRYIHRQATGSDVPTTYVANGRIVPLPS